MIEIDFRLFTFCRSNSLNANFSFAPSVFDSVSFAPWPVFHMRSCVHVLEFHRNLFVRCDLFSIKSNERIRKAAITTDQKKTTNLNKCVIVLIGCVWVCDIHNWLKSNWFRQKNPRCRSSSLSFSLAVVYLFIHLDEYFFLVARCFIPT